MFMDEQVKQVRSSGGRTGHWEVHGGTVVSAVRGYDGILPNDAGDYDVDVSPVMFEPLKALFKSSPVRCVRVCRCNAYVQLTATA